MAKDIICVGDSLTHGIVGWSYIDFSRLKSRMVNHGVDGDTLAGVTQRIDAILANSPDAQHLVLSIGTNDTVFPFLSTQFGWRKEMTARSKLKQCERVDERFAENYRSLVQRISSAGLSVVLVGLPLVEMKGFPTAELARRSDLIKQIADEQGTQFVDIADAMRKVSQVHDAHYSWTGRKLLRVADAKAMQVAPQIKDRLARSRRLDLTVDGVHWTSETAGAIARAIDSALVP
ncbi:SGNH/GDSL hydrolase family protein [Corynebacterium sp. H130]|uniref:SGNH/GDSL hydrolase family protein n=1 Tax=Corynebacterium sp. H130 TaxID=3133444 RepID=UPI00309E82F0